MSNEDMLTLLQEMNDKVDALNGKVDRILERMDTVEELAVDVHTQIVPVIENIKTKGVRALMGF